MKVLYMPARIIAHFLGGVVGKKLNAGIWAKISDQPKPPTNADGQTLAQVAGGAALQAAILAATAGVADQLAARVFHYFFGVWPAHPKPTKDAKSEASEDEGKRRRASKSKNKNKPESKDKSNNKRLSARKQTKPNSDEIAEPKAKRSLKPKRNLKSVDAASPEPELVAAP